MKTIGIMQPYFLPYIGYFQLINMVDEFVLYDAIEFTKRGWIHRNRMLLNGSDEYFTLPLKKDSDYLCVNQRFLTENFQEFRAKLLRKIEQNYKKAPYFEAFFPYLLEILDYKETNLFDYIFNSIQVVNKYLGITTPIIISSSLPEEITQLKGQEKVLELCKQLKADIYINSSGGVALYQKEVFKQHNITLKFFRTDTIEYKQFNHPFVHFLSILDVVMFNSKEQILTYLNSYHFIDE
ncbi:MAG: WbqC family protein [Flavobacteriaceae bacterium]|jgi:hypothetical protein|nr:WbqC family protein [Flavobacteriaceae bacterium]